MDQQYHGDGVSGEDLGTFQRFSGKEGKKEVGAPLRSRRVANVISINPWSDSNPPTAGSLPVHKFFPISCA